MDDNINVYEVVKRLIGPIDPVGETNTDEIRLRNLATMTILAGNLIHDIKYVAEYKINHEYSVKQAGLFADKFLKELGCDPMITGEEE